MLEIITFFIFLLGIFTVGLSVIVAIRFYSYQKNLTGNARFLSSAISWQLIGEAVIGLGTLTFSAAAYYEVLPDWDMGIQSGIRFVMFFATSATTAHLLRVLSHIEG